MEKAIMKIGHSLAVIIPRPLAKAAGFRAGQRVLLQEESEGITIRRAGQRASVDLRGKVPSVGFRLLDQRRTRRALASQWKRRWKGI
ncbi:MAG: AbrB/MazE/SpoVT family DNA-binding domain-containing protein [Deltaproteobacteria bacterium]|nr:AbrB/MazE/SpoVT family DNA-binding domain-containing protein [Deltaproteobacteria bacterium]